MLSVGGGDEIQDFFLAVSKVASVCLNRLCFARSYIIVRISFLVS